MKKILVILMLVFAFGCSDDATAPEPHEIVGKWFKNFSVVNGETGERIDVKLVLEFLNNGTFKMFNEQPEEEMFDEQGTYTISNDELTIENSKCENSEGRYKFEFKVNGVQFTKVVDECNYTSILNGFFLDYDVVLED